MKIRKAPPVPPSWLITLTEEEAQILSYVLNGHSVNVDESHLKSISQGIDYQDVIDTIDRLWNMLRSRGGID
jgi:hypothetical protein